jgi:flavin reductase ActVB
MTVTQLMSTVPEPRLPPAAVFTNAMSRFAAGVVLVTSWIDGRPWGMTVSAFASVSAEPPTILVSLSSASASAQAIADDQQFGVSILERGQVAAARHGSMPGASKFIERFVERGRTVNALPAVAGALAHLDCEVIERLEVADHTIFVGRVRSARLGSAGEPLVYADRAYRALDPAFNPRRNGAPNGF